MSATAGVLGGFARSVATTAACNVAAAAASGIAGVVVARALGPSLRGEYAAIMAWFAVVLVVGQLGQTAATTYFVARVPERGRDYLATSRNLMVACGLVALTAGVAVAPLLAPDDETVVLAHRLMFATCLAAFAGAGYVFALHAVRLRRWNLVRTAQPVAFLAAVGGLHLAGELTLLTAVAALSATVAAQSVLAYLLCRGSGLTGGRAEAALAGPMCRYGLAQLAGSVPAVITARLDQLVLSFLVASAVLGNYAVAASLTAVAVPLVAAFGNVAFPRMASRVGSASNLAALQRWTLLASAAVGVCLTVPLAVLAPRLIPWVFGPGYADAVALVWLLAPGGILFACAHVGADLLRGHGRPLAVARAQWVAAGVMIVLLAVLVPPLGAVGAAIASSAAAAAAMLLIFRSLVRTAPTGGLQPAAVELAGRMR
ncbi:oligosaccharide flippase family protein [Glycomyces sp. L485]|uniref:oligosaccharide flippase family protein n=1 Tax=Glycomyces sp. L485 TaxID=2909235 RepID=UPI001F4B449B|nr:oligosaccharide flippase family protein [Glycomyces sp. L485]MCH7230591.1 oligosaccharide flippase family protein [Glycomyces sp. L485]